MTRNNKLVMYYKYINNKTLPLFIFVKNATKTTLLIFVSLTRLKVILTLNKVSKARTFKDSLK